MRCFCGCGKKVGRRQIDLNTQAGTVALELLAWDKARAAGHLGPPAADDGERVIKRGADCYQRLLAALHGEDDAYSIEEGQDWLKRSEAERQERRYMTSKGGLLSRRKLTLTEEDYERLDRAHPELSFSAQRPAHAAEGRAAGQLERLSALHAEGVLSDEELAAARARVLGRAS